MRIMKKLVNLVSAQSFCKVVSLHVRIFQAYTGLVPKNYVTQRNLFRKLISNNALSKFLNVKKILLGHISKIGFTNLLNHNKKTSL